MRPSSRSKHGLDALKTGDYGTAIKGWRPLAERGNVAAQFYLGRLHDQRWGVPQDYAEAAKRYRRAADMGHARAQHNLGSMYEDGRGVARDHAVAIPLYCRALRQGDGPALAKPGSLHSEGHGVVADDVRAHMYFFSQPSAATGSPRWRAITAQGMTLADVFAALRLARAWTPAAPCP